MSQKANDKRSNVKNPLHPAFKDAADNRSVQKNQQGDKQQGNEQKGQGGSAGGQAGHGKR